jgi:hypothetical protein
MSGQLGSAILLVTAALSGLAHATLIAVAAVVFLVDDTGPDKLQVFP